MSSSLSIRQIEWVGEGAQQCILVTLMNGREVTLGADGGPKRVWRADEIMMAAHREQYPRPQVGPAEAVTVPYQVVNEGA